MAKKTTGFTIRETELASILEIDITRLVEIITFFDSDSKDQWELKENDHFIFLNKSLNERLFSEQGAYAIAKYIDDTQPQNFWERILEFITRHKEKIRNAFINQKIQENCSSLTTRNNRHFLSKKDVVNIFCTNYARINRAFEELKASDDPLIIYEDFDDIDGVRYYSLSGVNRLSRHLAKKLTVKDRRSWCEAVEVVGKKTFKILIDAETVKQKRIESAMGKARRRDHNQCQITGVKRDRQNRSVNIVVHHVYDRKTYPHLADCVDNLVTMSQEVHNDFHTWNGGYQQSCTADNLIAFIQNLYPDNYEITLRLNRIKQILSVRS